MFREMRERVDRELARSNVVSATVVDVDLTHTSGAISTPVQVAFRTGDAATRLWLPAANGVVPQVGEQVTVLFNGADAIIVPRPGTVTEGGWFSSNFPGFGLGGPGWGIDHEGNCEFNDATFRGDVTFQPDELIENGHFDTTIDPWTDDGAANVDVARVVPPGGGFAAGWGQTVAGAGPAPIAHPPLPVREGRTYRLTASLHTSNSLAPFLTSRVTLRLRWLDDVGATISESSVTPPLRTGWNDGVAFAARAPAGAVEVVPLFIATYDQAHPTLGPGAWADNISCREVSSIRSGHLEGCTVDELHVDGTLRVGGSLVGPRTGVSLVRVTNANITTLATIAVSWEAAFHEAPNGYWTSGTTVTIPEGMDGLYAVNFSCIFTGAAATLLWPLFSVRSVGSTVPTLEQFSSFSGSRGWSFTEWLEAGDTFTCQVHNSGGSTITLDLAHLQMHRLVTG